MIKFRLAAIVFLIILLIPFDLPACSAFFYNGERKLFGKNFDWVSGDGFVIKNNRGVLKYSYGIRGTNQAKWVAKYGSVTFNQVGKENPYGGMNEKGLVVEQLWLNSSYYQDNKNETISELEWIQFQLDNFSSVAEIIANIHDLTIQPTKATVHYLVADKEGNSAVIDFVNGNAVISKSESRAHVITNSTYHASRSYFEKFGESVKPDSRTSEDRFCQLTNHLSKGINGGVEQAFTVLDASAEDRPNYKTYWTIVYDLENAAIHYKSYNNKEVKTIRIGDYSYNEKDAIVAAEINADDFKFDQYTMERNSALLTASLQMMGLKLDSKLANEHQMNPGQRRIDTIYQRNYIDLTVTFHVRKREGVLFYTIIQGEENFKKRKGVYAVRTPVSGKVIQNIIYAFPKGEYAIASFHDINGDNALDKGLFGIPKAFAFSNNARNLFGLPPRYRKAKINLQKDTGIRINIK
jgi:penicillin V acylase-like amidase (Ntn superfamily)/uncharacterized protein (DUF2141 family)